MTTELQTELSLFINSITGVVDTIPIVISDWLNWNMGCAIICVLIGVAIIGGWFIIKKLINNRKPTFDFNESEQQIVIIGSGLVMWLIGFLLIMCNIITIVKIAVYPNVFIIDKLLSGSCS